MSATSGRDIAVSFIGGFVAALLLIVGLGIIAIRQGDNYGLAHWKLNARMPLASTWMNLGYWINSNGEPVQIFEEACANLLREILRTAGLLRESKSSDQSSAEPQSLAVLDLGFGCGDQTFELVRQTQPSQGWSDFRYVGLTLNSSQVRTAGRHVARELADGDTHGLTSDSFKLFCADAAKPNAWDAATKEAVESLGDATKYKERWLLALDCLYHFRPSRKPVFSYAAKELNANAMAFDLLLSDNPSTKNKWLARLVCFIMRCPIRTFMTETEYRRQLADCGYDPEQITVKDITEHVLVPVSAFLERQERALSHYGVSMGGYKLAGRIFSWFGRSGVVKAVIVVARTPKIDGKP